MGQFFLVLFVAFGGTFFSVISGGGSSIINIPVWVWLGLPLPLAFGVEKINGTFWVLPASINYLKGRKVHFLFIFVFALVGLVGVYAGVKFILNIDERVAEILIGSIIVVMAAFVSLKKEIGMKPKKAPSKIKKTLSYLFALPMGFYESFFGSGNGMFFSLATIYTRGFDFVEALGHYFAVAFFWLAASAALFIYQGYFDLMFSIPAVIGSVAGSYFGSKYGKKKGNKFIKLAFTIVGGLLGLKLILGL